MEKFIPYEKLSKKKKRAPDAKRRGTWGEIKPVTRQQESGRRTTEKRHRTGRRNIPILCLPFCAASGGRYVPFGARRKR